MNIKDIWSLIKDSFSAWIDDFAPSMGAALSYYTLFSLAPLLLIVIGIAGLVFGQEAAQGDIVEQLTGLLGSKGAEAIQTMLKSASNPASGVIATVVGSITLLVGATTVFNELQDDLDRIWKAKRPSGGIGMLIRTRLLSLGIILGAGFLLTISLLLSAGLAALGKYWGSLFGNLAWLLQIVNFLVSIGVITLLFAMIYKILPSVNLMWRDVWVGAIVTSLLFAAGKLLIGLYIGASDVASAYGAAGAFVIVLLWVYYSSQIFLLGAEFTRIYADRHGSRKQTPTTEGKDVNPPGIPPALLLVAFGTALLVNGIRRRD